VSLREVDGQRDYETFRMFFDAYKDDLHIIYMGKVATGGVCLQHCACVCLAVEQKFNTDLSDKNVEFTS